MEFMPPTHSTFAVIFLPEISTTKLKIPSHIYVVHESVTLRDKYKNSWQVKVRKVDGQWYLLEGWAKFVIDNSIAIMDVLAFDYSGSCFLDVNIFGSNGEIKAGVGYRKQEAMEQRKSMNDNHASSSRILHRKKRNIDCLNKGILKSGLASKLKRSYSVKTMKPLHGNEMNKGKEIWNKVSENEDDSEEGSIELTPRRDQKDKRRMGKELKVDARIYTIANSENRYQKRRNIDWCGNKIITSRSAARPNIPSSAAKMTPLQIKEMDNSGKEIVYESSDKDSDYCNEINGLEKSRKLKLQGRNIKITKPIKRTRVKYLGKKLFESGVIPRPEGRYFVTKMNKKNNLYIPKSILKDKNICLPQKMILVDPSGDKYDAKLISWSGGRKVYKGCSSLCKKNHLTRNDFCICEFGEGNQAGFLYINILRRVRP